MKRSHGLKMLFSVFPVAALVAVVFWLIFVVKYEDQSDKSSTGALAHEYKQKADISFQAVVATILVYFVSHHGLDQLLMMMGRAM